MDDSDSFGKARKSLVFSLRGPIPIQLDEHSSSSACNTASSSSTPWSSGASVLDLVFPQAETVSEIHFKNWYTASFTLLVRFDDSVQTAPKREHLAWAAAASLSLARLRGVDSSEGIKIGRSATGSKSLSDWVVSIQNRQLMPDPHSESGSQDQIIITSSDSLVPMHDITALRFLLRQPSPNWKTFNLENIAVYRHPIINFSSSRTLNYLGSVEGGGREQQRVVESHPLEVLARHTREALSGKVFRLEADDGEETSSAMLPTSYDIISLQLS